MREHYFRSVVDFISLLLENKALWIEEELHFDSLSVCKKLYTFRIILKGNKFCHSPLPAVALLKDI